MSDSRHPQSEVASQGAEERPPDAADAAVPGDAEVRMTAVVDESHAGGRLDAILAAVLTGVSRARIRRAIDGGLVLVDGLAMKAAGRVTAGARIEITLPPAPEGPLPEPIPLTILYEDESLIVVDKPPGMVVHPAKGHWQGTLAAALVHHCGALSTTGGATRPGIVHRLDRDTSGVIVAAKTDAVHQALAEQFHARTVEKEYLALVAGSPNWDADRVNLPVGPHPTHREKMALRPNHPESRPAETFFEVVKRYRGFALMRAKPRTGRTHQIRLHLAHLRCPVLCDKHYGGRAKITAGELRTMLRDKTLAADLAEDAVLLDRQALHAHRLSFDHPTTGLRMTFEAPLPADIRNLQAILQQSSRAC